MKWKEFFLDRRKIVILLVLLILSVFIQIGLEFHSGGSGGYYKFSISNSEYNVSIFPITGLGGPCIMMVGAICYHFRVNLQFVGFLYLYSILIIWIYDKVKKK